MGRNLTTKIRRRCPSLPHLYLCLPFLHHSILGKHAHTVFLSFSVACMSALLFVVGQAIQKILYRGYTHETGEGGDPLSGISQAWEMIGWDECVTNWTDPGNHGTPCVTRNKVALKFHASFFFKSSMHKL